MLPKIHATVTMSYVRCWTIIFSFKMTAYITYFYRRHVTIQITDTSIRDKTPDLCIPDLKCNELHDVCVLDSNNSTSNR